jgi:hypothetical protein
MPLGATTRMHAPGAAFRLAPRVGRSTFEGGLGEPGTDRELFEAAKAALARNLVLLASFIAAMYEIFAARTLSQAAFTAGGRTDRRSHSTRRKPPAGRSTVR